VTAEVRSSYAVLGMVLGWGLLVGCDVATGSDGPAASEWCEGLADDCSHVVEVRGAHAHFSVRVPASWGIVDLREDAVCDSASYKLGELPGGEGRLRAEAVPAECEVAEANDTIGNGTHGTYRTIEDVPEPQQVAQVETVLGEAVLFTQEYFECTNSCERWQEPVAIITLDEPVDRDYPTLVLRGERDELSVSDLEDILDALEQPYPPPAPRS
jgi:hypothetical protein